MIDELPDDAVVLTDDETEALAYHLLATYARWCQDWLEWEDVPMLSEFGFEKLAESVKAIGGRLASRSNEKVDALSVLEKVQ